MRHIMTQGREIVSTLVLLGKWVPVRLSATEVLYLYAYHTYTRMLGAEVMRRAASSEASPGCSAQQRAWHRVGDEQGCGHCLLEIQQRARKTYRLLKEASALPQSLTLAPEDALALGLKSLQLRAWITILLADEERAEIVRVAQGRVVKRTLTDSGAKGSGIGHVPHPPMTR
jgi:hypothetical protein